CMLAFLDDSQREEILGAGLVALTSGTIVDPDVLRDELERIVERRYAASAGERQADAGSVAAPVFGVSGEVLGAISVCGPRYRVTDEFVAAIAPRVVAVADHISHRLGAAPRRTPVLAGSAAERTAR
ncbi:IclR family transcriptional regulator domain-containing protein, partial [Actinomycetospora sp.]|uniref:IclR family transcriptional regulator domain-containing protein n=1 Tax=Actinomycetospora sp. TaxID=1872135 RepID=UPI002F4225D1